MTAPADPTGWIKLGELGFLFVVLFGWVAWEFWTLRRDSRRTDERRK